MPDDIASLAIRIESLEVLQAERRLGDLSRAGGVAERQNRGLAASGKALGLALGAVGVSVAAIGVGVNLAVKSWLEYDKAIKEVRSITGQSREEFAHFRDEVLEVAAALGVDATVAARGLYEALSAGIPKENAIEFLKIASSTAVAGVTEVNVAVDGLTTVINAFKLPVSQAEDIADKFLQTVNDGKTTFEQMAKNVSDAAIPMAALGGTFEELFAQIAALTAQGVPTSQAFTMVKASVNALMNPSKEMAGVMEQLGVKGGRAMVAQYGFAGSLEQVTQKLQGNDAALFGAMRSSEGFSQILATSGKNADALAKFYDNLNKSSGNVGRAYATNADTLQISLVKLKSAATNLVETMEGSLSVIATFAKALEGAALLIEKVARVKSLSTQAENVLASVAGGVTAKTSAELNRQISDLEIRSQILKENLKRDKPTIVDAVMGAHPGLNLLPNKTNDDIDELIANTREVGKLKDAYGKLDDNMKKQGETYADMLSLRKQNLAAETQSGNVLPERGAIEQAQLETNLDLLIKEQEMKVVAAKWQEDNNKAALAGDTERTLAAQLAHETNKKTAAEVLEADKAALKLGEQLGKTKREIKEDEIKTLETVRLRNGATEQDIKYAENGIALLKEELLLLDEKGNKIPSARAVKEGGGGSANMTPTAAAIVDEMTPIFEAPTRNQFEELAKQEADVIKSYNRRKVEILAITGITESERASLIHNSNRQLKEASVHFDKERNSAMLQQTGDLYGNLSTIAGVFGKKAHKIAQATSIAQATMSAYQAANTALASTPPPYSYVAAAAAVAMGIANVAKIASTPYAGAFAQGGIVPGGSFSGDNLTASVNSGEMILNGGQQKSLFDIANGKNKGGSANVEVTIINNTGEKVTQKESGSGDKRMIEFIIGQASDKVAGDIQKGGTRVSKAIEGTYNLGRGGK